MGHVIDGKAIAAAVRAEVKARVTRLRTAGDDIPGLATLLVGDNPASDVYIRTKERACNEVGIESIGQRLPASTSEGELLAVIDALNERRDVHGILVQLPLPVGLNQQRVSERISRRKDVDGLHPHNQGSLLAGAQSTPVK